MNYIKYNLKEWENVLGPGSERDDITFRICKDTDDGDIEDSLKLISEKYRGLQRARGPFIEAVRIIGERIDSTPISNIELALYWIVSQSEIVSKYGNKLTGRERAVIKCELNSGNIIWLDISTISRDKRVQDLITGNNKSYKKLDQVKFSEIFLKDICKGDFMELLSLNKEVEGKYNIVVDIEYITKHLSRELFKYPIRGITIYKPLTVMHTDLKRCYMRNRAEHTSGVIFREFSELLCVQRTLKNDKLAGDLFITKSRDKLIPLITSMPVTLRPTNIKDPMIRSKIKGIILKCVSNYNRCINENGEYIRYNSITVEVISDLLYEILTNGEVLISEIELENGLISQGTGIGKSIVELMDSIIGTFESDSHDQDRYKTKNIEVKHEWVFNERKDTNPSESVNEEKIELNVEVRLTSIKGEVETVSLSSAYTNADSFKEEPN